MQIPRQLCCFSATMLLLTLPVAPSVGQRTEPPAKVQAKKVEIPHYVPLAQQAAISGTVTLHLVVSRDGKVVSADVVSAEPDGWGKWFSSTAADAAKRSEFVCPSCSGETFEHTITYQFDFPPIPKDACTPQAPALPRSKVDSPTHVTVRPSLWPCVEP
jgi:TonB family protein